MDFELRGETEIVLRRRFQAPRDIVFRCFTDPKIASQWMTCGLGKSLHCAIDTEIGGLWRHKVDMGDKEIYDCFGQTLEIEPPKRFARTNVLNSPGYREAVFTEAVTFDEAPDATRVEVVIRHLCREFRDGFAGSGVKEHLAAGYSLLDDLLADELC